MGASFESNSAKVREQYKYYDAECKRTDSDELCNNPEYILRQRSTSKFDANASRHIQSTGNLENPDFVQKKLVWNRILEGWILTVRCTTRDGHV